MTALDSAALAQHLLRRGVAVEVAELAPAPARLPGPGERPGVAVDRRVRRRLVRHPLGPRPETALARGDPELADDDGFAGAVGAGAGAVVGLGLVLVVLVEGGDVDGGGPVDVDVLLVVTGPPEVDGDGVDSEEDVVECVPDWSSLVELTGEEEGGEGVDSEPEVVEYVPDRSSLVELTGEEEGDRVDADVVE